MVTLPLLIEFVDAHVNVGEGNWAHDKCGHLLLHDLNKHVVFFVLIKACRSPAVKLLVAFRLNHLWGCINVVANRISVVFLGNGDY